MRVVALVEAVDHVCCRYRIAAFREPFAAAGHELQIQTLPRTTFGRLRIGQDLAHADAVIVQRKLLPRWAITLLRRRVRRLIFDFDDAIWLRDSYSPNGLDDPKRARRFRAMVAASDVVVAGNDFLADEAAKFAAGERVVVIPTCVDVARYPLYRKAPKEGLQLVWIGSQSTLQGMERFAATLSAIGGAVPGTRLKLICDRFLKIPGLAVDECHWSEETEGQEIAAADVGVTWIPDDLWSRGKCGLKLLQYQAAGLPVVANPVGVHTSMIDDGKTGYLASSTEEWLAAIRRLATDPLLSQRMGFAGRRQVEEKYSVAAGARSWLSLLERAAQPLRKSG